MGLDKSTDKSTDKGTDKSTDKGTDKSTDKGLDRQTEGKTAAWVREGYDNGKGAYILGYYVDGVRLCTMWGYYRDTANVFTVYPRWLDPAGRAFPKVNHVSVFDVKRAPHPLPSRTEGSS